MRAEQSSLGARSGSIRVGGVLGSVTQHHVSLASSLNIPSIILCSPASMPLSVVERILQLFVEEFRERPTPASLDPQSPHLGAVPFFLMCKYRSSPPGVLMMRTLLLLVLYDTRRRCSQYPISLFSGCILSFRAMLVAEACISDRTYEGESAGAHCVGVDSVSLGVGEEFG